MVLPYCRFLIREKKNKKDPCGFIRKSLWSNCTFLPAGIVSNSIIPRFHSYFKFYLQEKYPQPKPEVFSRKDVMENQVNVNSSRVQGLHLTVRLALERTALMVRGI